MQSLLLHNDFSLTAPSKTREFLSSKAAFTIAFSLPSIMITLPKQRTLKHKFTQDRLKSTNHNAQTMTF